MRKSKIFGNKELEMLENRIKGDRKDPNALWCRKVKPKVIEIVEVWIPRKKDLNKTLQTKQPSVPSRKPRKGKGG